MSCPDPGERHTDNLLNLFRGSSGLDEREYGADDDEVHWAGDHLVEERTVDRMDSADPRRRTNTASANSGNLVAVNAQDIF